MNRYSLWSALFGALSVLLAVFNLFSVGGQSVRFALLLSVVTLALVAFFLPRESSAGTGVPRGALEKEVSSGLAFAELEALRAELREQAAELARRRGIQTSLRAVNDEFAGVEIGRDTSAALLNALLSRYPQTPDLNG